MLKSDLRSREASASAEAKASATVEQKLSFTAVPAKAEVSATGLELSVTIYCSRQVGERAG